MLVLDMKFGSGTPYHVGVVWMKGWRRDVEVWESGPGWANTLVVTVPYLEAKPGRRRRTLVMVPEAETRDTVGCAVDGMVLGCLDLSGGLAARV
jgi:hypothetical protein